MVLYSLTALKTIHIRYCCSLSVSLTTHCQNTSPSVQSACVSSLVTSTSLQPHGLEPTRLLCPWDSPGKNTGVGGHFLLQGIFPTQGLNPGLLQCRKILYHLNYQESIQVGSAFSPIPLVSRIVSDICRFSNK